MANRAESVDSLSKRDNGVTVRNMRQKSIYTPNTYSPSKEYNGDPNDHKSYSHSRENRVKEPKFN
jgi:hypothetical protein